MHKYRVRLTKLLNAWVEVEASTRDEAEDIAWNKCLEKEMTPESKSDQWRDDGDIQIEDTTIFIDGYWEDVGSVAKENGGDKCE